MMAMTTKKFDQREHAASANADERSPPADHVLCPCEMVRKASDRRRRTKEIAVQQALHPAAVPGGEGNSTRKDDNARIF